MKVLFATISLIVFSFIGISYATTPIYYSEKECNIRDDLKRHAEILREDIVVKTFLHEYPDAVSFTAGGIDESDPPQTSVHYKYEIGDSNVQLTLRVFEHLADPHDCFKPFSYVLNYNDGEKTIQIINYEEKTQEILDFLASPQNRISETKYFLDPSYSINSLKYKQYEYFIPYRITNASIEKIELNCETSSLLIYLQDAADGNILVNIPRKMLNSKGGHDDADFIVLMNREETLFEEIESNLKSRTLSISFSKDTELIEIIATQWAGGASEYPPTCATTGSGESQYYRLLSPLQQFRAQISLPEIKCKENLTLLKKTSNGTPICVSVKAGQKLLERKWAQPTTRGISESMSKPDSDSYRREITILSITPQNVTLPEPKNQAYKTKCNADGVCFMPE